MLIWGKILKWGGGRLKNLSNFYHAFWLLLTKQNQRNVMLMFIVKYLHTKKKHDPCHKFILVFEILDKTIDGLSLHMETMFRLLKIYFDSLPNSLIVNYFAHA